jgi:hypothetical protein
VRVPWLADVLRDAGLTVVESPGWRGRGREMNRVSGIVWHDTVTPRTWSDAAVVRLLRDGYATLPGPLSQLGLDRSLRFHVIADGRCNHNGYGRWGNDAIGIETFANGGGSPKEPWSAGQREAAAIASAAILRRLKLDESRVQGHKETDPGRKQDPYGTSMAAGRRRVAELLTTKDDEMTPAQEAKLDEALTLLRSQQDVNRRVRISIRAIGKWLHIPTSVNGKTDGTEVIT